MPGTEQVTVTGPTATTVSTHIYLSESPAPCAKQHVKRWDEDRLGSALGSHILW